MYWYEVAANLDFFLIFFLFLVIHLLPHNIHVSPLWSP